MMGLASILLYGLVVYVGVGVVTALAFVCLGISRVLAHPASVTIGARILFIPGAFALWPYILVRWLRAGGKQ